jgi:hypothetical protein
MFLVGRYFVIEGPLSGKLVAAAIVLSWVAKLRLDTEGDKAKWR